MMAYSSGPVIVVSRPDAPLDLASVVKFVTTGFVEHGFDAAVYVD
jgi:hypothetical protein